MRPAVPVLAAAALALAGCSSLAPFATTPHAAKAGARETGPRVAVCSDGLVSSRAEVRAAAQQQCPAHTVATLAATDWWLQHCPILVPARSTFRCVPAK
jgi:hypothetical protein